MSWRWLQSSVASRPRRGRRGPEPAGLTKTGAPHAPICSPPTGLRAAEGASSSRAQGTSHQTAPLSSGTSEQWDQGELACLGPAGPRSSGRLRVGSWTERVPGARPCEGAGESGGRCWEAAVGHRGGVSTPTGGRLPPSPASASRTHRWVPVTPRPCVSDMPGFGREENHRAICRTCRPPPPLDIYTLNQYLI